MSRDALDRLGRELVADLPLPPGDWEAVLARAAQVLEAVRILDELPLDDVEPAALYRVVP